MADYTTTNYSISNPLNRERIDNRYCPLCKKDLYGAKIYDNHYKLRLSLYNGNPCTQVPERKDLEIDLCFDCRNKIYKAIKKEVEKIEKIK